MNIDRISVISDRYDLFVFDQWGVLHNGQAPYPGVLECLAGLRETGKQVVVLSNSSRRAAINEERLSTVGINRDLYRQVVTSGETTWQLLRDRDTSPFDSLKRTVLLIDRLDAPCLIEGLNYRTVMAVKHAAFVLLTGVPMDDWRDRLMPTLIAAAQGNLPMICANPDLISITPSNDETDAPGRVAAAYRSVGGQTRQIGKPFPEIYAAVAASPGRTLMIGDSLLHDIKGAMTQSWDSLLITGGVHRRELADKPANELFTRYQAMPTYLSDAVRW